MVKKKKENEIKEYGDTRPFYDKVLRSGVITSFLSGQKTHRVATAMIYERVGDTEYFLGGYPLMKGKYHQIGEYYVLELGGSKRYYMDCLGSEVFTPCKDPKIGKVVEIVKYTDDDFRVRNKLNKNFYTKRKIIKYDEKPTILTDENDSPLLDEDGEPVQVRVPSRDEFGNVIYEEIVEEYVEPKGVTQDGRNAIRIHNHNKEEIKAFKERNEGFWEKFNKHGGMTVVALALVVLGMIVMGKMMTDSWKEGVQTLSNDIKDANNNMKWWQQPDALNKISDAVTQKQDEKKAPPVT